MSFVFPPGDTPRAAIHGSEQWFPVHRIYCVGQNYASHAREMGDDPDREPPFFFSKPADAVVLAPAAGARPGRVPYPTCTKNLHHEIELVAALGQGGRDIRPEDAWSHVFGLAVGLDLTRRDLQQAAKDQGRPWDTAKGFDQSAPISPIRLIRETGCVSSGAIWLDVNGERRQTGDIADMIWNIAELLAGLSTLYQLLPGDLVFTGTPAGVGAVQRGDLLEGGVDGVATLAIRVE
ncbi:MAG TPA: fumarylacetoacetate hydrolase family protein [Xanthomonadales bacterium]|nr:fumarylacetoacetate hydrolase family protein [Xanthomonadales bacterium]